MSLIRGALQPGLSVVKKTAPFYSAVDEALAAIKRPKGTGAEFYTELTKQAGVKKAELADRKLEQAFKAKGKMTKEEAQQVLKDNPPPKLQERQFTEISDDERDNLLRDRIETSGYDSWDEVPSRVIQKWNDEIDADMEKYGDYKTAGGKNYREIILKLPASRPNPNNYRDKAQYDADMRSFNASGKADYQSSHWKEDPNVLAHMRVQDRKGPNGEKILHVEEIQSDWHQEGRKKGYGPKLEEQYRAYYTTPDGQQVDIGFGKTPEQVEQMTKAAGWDTMPIKIETEKTVRKIGEGVPDAPFKKNWHELAMKRLLNYAADNGYDSIAITPGAEQAKRFSLSKQIDELIYSDDGSLYASKGGKKVFNERLTPEQLPDYVGKEVAEKLVSAQPNEVGSRVLGGLDLEVGGEGMKGFYDKILPDYLNTFGKPYGAQVGQANAIMSNPTPEQVRQFHNIGILRFDIKTPEEKELLKQQMLQAQVPLHNFPITPEMRESIKQKGLPLYQQVGIPTAGAGAASQMPEPEEEPQYGPGGAITKMALKAAPPPRSPAIMRSNILTNVKSAVRQEQGQYGARRLDRAADEIPNLEKMFNQNGLMEAFTGDNARGLMTMDPADFNKYAVKLEYHNRRPKHASFEDRLKSGDVDQLDMPTEEYLKYLLSLPNGFDYVPFLEISKEKLGSPSIPFISGHEGRHRNKALANSGEKKSLVQLLPEYKLRESFPSRSQEEYIEALKKELEMTGNIVAPEDYGTDKRPPIILPDIYAKGGAVKPKVKDTKSGKVRMTTNRDTMFMELSNKKLKRK